MNWLTTEFLEIVEAPTSFTERIHQFDYQNANLQQMISKLSMRLPINYRHALIYDAIRMSQADDVYAYSEKMAVQRTAEMLGIPVYLAKTIEGLIRMESSLADTRNSVFELESVFSPLPTYSERNASVQERYWFGYTATSNLAPLFVFKALQELAGTDQATLQLMNLWKNEYLLRAYRLSPEVFKAALEPLPLPLNDILREIRMNCTLNTPRMIYYLCLKMTRYFPDKAGELATFLDRVAGDMSLSNNMSRTLEYLADTEEKIGQMRQVIFEPNP